jgi:hypothetical protein
MKTPFPVVPLDLPVRRAFLLNTFRTAGAVGLAGFLAACGGDDDAIAGPSDPKPPVNPPVDPPVNPPAAPFNAFAAFSELQPADANGVMLPKGFTSRIVARSSQAPVSGGSYKWHPAPDGGATFATPDGGWVYVSNSEVGAPEAGAGAIKFDKTGKVIDAYPILKGTNNNCAGGPTPWNTWLSCEEFESSSTVGGQVWECDPFTPWTNAQSAKALPALGKYAHEAISIDPVNRTLYLTEDASGGRVYRFVCDAEDWPAGAARPRMERGRLEVLRIAALPANADSSDPAYASTVGFGKPPTPVIWESAVSPELGQKAVRTAINNGGLKAPGNYFEKAEGTWFFNGIVFFVTSYNYRIWAYDTTHQTLEVIYDGKLAPANKHSINEPDNITITPLGEMLVAEDSGNLELSVLRDDGTSQPVMRLFGHDASEITGPAVSPDGLRLYFSSQRGTTGNSEDGITYEILLPTKLVV